MTKTKNTKSTKASNQDKASHSWLRWCLMTSLKIALISICALAVYTIYLDGKVRQKFEGQRWQVPIQVFGQGEVFNRGDKLDLATFANTLKFAGYRKVSKVQSAGEFALSGKRIIVFRHAFEGDEYLYPSQTITLTVKQNRISTLHYENQPVNSVHFEPVLIDRILPNTKEDRVIVPLEQVPELLLDTLLLVEDRDFYFHHGVSPTGILRALYNNILAGRTVQGGSTLTQQLVKNMYLTRDKTMWRKANEAIMSLILEFRYSKDLLLEAYLNEVYLGQHYANGIYGFGLAAEFYFGRKIEQLSVEQIAMLVGQVKGPSYYDPWRRTDNALKRRDLVLGLMFKHELIDKAHYQVAVNAPLSVRKSRRLVKEKYPAYLQLVKRELAEHLSTYDQQSGIKVFTGFSLYQQQLLEQTVDEQLPELMKKDGKTDLETAMVVSDIASGEVRALIGGKKSGYAGFNRAIQASRPIGSLIKTAVYIAALERFEQYHLATLLDDKKISLASDNGKTWQPKNYDGKYRGSASLLDSLVYSLNIPTVNLGMKLGMDNVADVLHVLGYQQDIALRPSLLLGSLNMSPIDVNQLYLPIAGQGQYQHGHTIRKITAGQDETIWQHMAQDQQILSSQASYLIDYALHEVTTRGTAKSLTWRLKGAEVAGKTGTTNDQRDSWFVGYDNQHLVTTWLGHDNNQSTAFTGSSGALVLFAKYMEKLGVDNKSPAIPEGIATQHFEKKTGNPVGENCADIVELPAVKRSLVISSECLEKQAPKKSWLERLFSD